MISLPYHSREASCTDIRSVGSMILDPF